MTDPEIDSANGGTVMKTSHSAEQQPLLILNKLLKAGGGVDLGAADDTVRCAESRRPPVASAV